MVRYPEIIQLQTYATHAHAGEHLIKMANTKAKKIFKNHMWWKFNNNMTIKWGWGEEIAATDTWETNIVEDPNNPLDDNNNRGTKKASSHQSPIRDQFYKTPRNLAL